MASIAFKASAPGNFMLLGEYAVLRGKQAVVCAVDKRIHVQLTPRADEVIHLSSPAKGEFTTDIRNIAESENFRFIVAILKRYQKRLPSGCTIHVESEFDTNLGLGSSAAVTVATLATISEWLNLHLPLLELAREARSIVQEVQGLGSGADVAASVFGGVIAYKMQPLVIERLPHNLALTLIYSGSKTPTVTAVNQVHDNYADYPKLLQQLCDAIHQCAVHGIEAIKLQDWKRLGKFMNIQQGIMQSLGVNTPIFADLIAELETQPHILGAKISGSGLGDCLIALGELSKSYQPKHAAHGTCILPATISNAGVACEKI